jgi:hypothetical protein
VYDFDQPLPVGIWQTAVFEVKPLREFRTFELICDAGMRHGGERGAPVGIGSGTHDIRDQSGRLAVDQRDRDGMRMISMVVAARACVACFLGSIFGELGFWGIGRNASWKAVSQSSYRIRVFDTIREAAGAENALPRVGDGMTAIDPQTRAVTITEASGQRSISGFPVYSNETQ